MKSSVLICLVVVMLLAGCQPKKPGLDSGAGAGTAAVSGQFLRLTAQGMEAVRMEEWTLARDYLAEAQAASPLEPQGIYNLAVAYDRLGHDVQAAYWYRAFLATGPESEAVEAVRQAALECEARSLVAALVLWDMALDRIGITPALTEGKAEALVLAGLATEARELAFTFKDMTEQASVLARVAVVLDMQGDSAGAREALESVPQEQYDLGVLLYDTNRRGEFPVEALSDNALSGWLAAIRALPPEVDTSTSGYMRTALAKAEAEDDLMLVNEAMVLTRSIADLQRVDRRWRRLTP